MSCKMEKSITVLKMALPIDISNYICSFIFYSNQYVVERNKQIFNLLMAKINITNKVYYTCCINISYHRYFIILIANPYLNKQKQLYICKKCSEFIRDGLRFSKCTCPYNWVDDD